MKKLTITMVAMAILMSCNKEQDLPATTPTTQEIQVKVVDYNSGSPVDSASVSTFSPIQNIGTTRVIKHMGHTNKEGLVTINKQVSSKLQVTKLGYFVQQEDDHPVCQKKDNHYTFFLLAIDHIDLVVEILSPDTSANQVFTVAVTGMMRDGSTRKAQLSNQWISLAGHSSQARLTIFKGIENKVDIIDRDGKIVRTETIPAVRTGKALAIEF
jgi:hypothetical protein